MASQPLVELAELDLDHVVVDRKTLDGHLMQRGTFEMLDGLLHEDAENGLLVGIKHIRAEDWWAPDHIPGRPMFPGVLMIESAAQLAAYDFSAHRITREQLGDRFIGFGGVDKARFRGLVEPGCDLLLVVKIIKGSSRMFRYAAQAFTRRDGQIGGMVFEAEILGVLV